MLRAERITKIYDMVKQRKILNVHEIMAEVEASKSTVLRDIDELHKTGCVEKTRGGIMWVRDENEKMEQPSLRTRSILFPTQKMCIAKKAMEYVAECSSIFLDSGTTTMAIAKEINQSLKKNLTVVTYDTRIVMELNHNPLVEVLMIGGLVRNKFTATTGFFAERMLAELHVNAVFLGADSVNLSDGVMNFRAEMINNKRMITSGIADKIILVCDYSKFTTHSLFKVCEVTDLYRIITNLELAPELVQQIRDTGVALDLV